MTLVYVDERFREIIISTINKTRVGLDFVTIQNRILKLDVWLLRKVFVGGGGGSTLDLDFGLGLGLGF